LDRARLALAGCAIVGFVHLRAPSGPCPGGTAGIWTAPNAGINGSFCGAAEETGKQARTDKGEHFSKTGSGKYFRGEPGIDCVEKGGAGEFASCYGVNLAVAGFGFVVVWLVFGWFWVLVCGWLSGLGPGGKLRRRISPSAGRRRRLRRQGSRLGLSGDSTCPKRVREGTFGGSLESIALKRAVQGSLLLAMG